MATEISALRLMQILCWPLMPKLPLDHSCFALQSPLKLAALTCKGSSVISSLIRHDMISKSEVYRSALVNVSCDWWRNDRVPN